jgi:ethanolaminephosphotransferase
MVFINFITMVMYDPGYLAEKGGAAGPPNWMYYTCVFTLSLRYATLTRRCCRWAVGLFIYQSLDAIDGKQARRTGMAGPLGEMFDHGE